MQDDAVLAELQQYQPAWDPQPHPPDPPDVTEFLVEASVSFEAPATPELFALPHNIPDFGANPTISSTASGDWSNAAIWNLGRIPGAGDIVRVAHTVRYNVVSNAAVRCVGITGVLRFATNTNTRLTVQTILPYEGGTLEVGIMAAPIQAGFMAEIVWADVPLEANDPEQFSNGLLGLGIVTMHGAPRTPTFQRLAAEALAGQSTIQLTEACNWQPGDVLMLPGTKLQWHLGIDVPTIKSVSGLTVTLTAPLTQSHTAGRDRNGAITFLPHVANLQRNVWLKSANPGGTRGHLLCTGHAQSDLRYVYFQNMGRTRHDVTVGPGNQIGRYPHHWHHCHMRQTMIGCTVQSSRKWGITVHGTHYSTVRDNVVYQCAGAGITTEDGSETGNIIDHNIVIWCTGIGEWAAERGTTGPDFGYEGSGFWFRGFGNYIRNNVAAQCRLYGYTYFAHSLGRVYIPPSPGAAPVPVDGNAQGIAQFENNEVYGSEDGATIWFYNCFSQTARGGPEGIVKTFKAWHINRYGYFGYHSNKLTFDGCVMRGDKTALANAGTFNYGFWYSDYFNREFKIINSDIQCFRVGIQAPVFMAEYGTAGSVMTLQNSYVSCTYGMLIEPMWTVAGTSGMPPKKVIITNSKAEPIPGMTGNQSGWLMNYKVGQYNLVQKDELIVYHHQQVANDNFQVYYGQQAPDFIVPQSGSGGYQNLIGSPEAGLTNAQNWAKYRIAIANAVAPCSSGKAMVIGYTCPIGAVIPPPITPKPAAPMNVRILIPSTTSA